MSHSLLAASSGLPLAVSQTASPVGIWKTLLTRLLAQHYGLTLSDTPFSNDSVIQAHIDAGIALIDALNFMVEKYDWCALTVRVSVRRLHRRSSAISTCCVPGEPPD